MAVVEGFILIAIVEKFALYISQAPVSHAEFIATIHASRQQKDNEGHVIVSDSNIVFYFSIW